MTTRKIIAEGVVYHITQRAPGRELLFIEDKDCLRFLYLLKETVRNFSIEILCFALLSNHLHILLQTKDKNLDKAMKYLFQSYAQGFNKKYERKGHVFCGVYRAVLCETDAHLLAASLYIHLNPFKARLTKDKFKYRWFSLTPYIRQIRTKVVSTKTILSMLDKDMNKARASYKKLFADADELRYKSILKDNNAVREFIELFIRWVKDKLTVFSSKSSIASFLELEKKIEEAKLRKRMGKPQELKAFAYLVEQLRSRGYSYNEIAIKTGLTRMSIFRRLKRC